MEALDDMMEALDDMMEALDDMMEALDDRQGVHLHYLPEIRLPCMKMKLFLQSIENLCYNGLVLQPYFAVFPAYFTIFARALN